MRVFLEKLGLVRPVLDAEPYGRHMAPWHPLFLKAVTFHIAETSATRGRLTR